MTVRIGSMTSEVVAEPEPEARADETMQAGEAWQQVDWMRSTLAALTRRDRRTSADGFDD